MDQEQHAHMLGCLKQWVAESPTYRGLLLIDHQKDLRDLSPKLHQGTARFQIFKLR
jgi:hypothetical protein